MVFFFEKLPLCIDNKFFIKICLLFMNNAGYVQCYLQQ